MGIPRIKPVQFEEVPTFRETFLVGFTEPGDADAFRRVGCLFFQMLNEYRYYFPDPVLPQPTPELQAVLADLRYLEGYLGIYLGPAYPFAGELAAGVHKVANRLDGALRGRRRF